MYKLFASYLSVFAFTLLGVEIFRRWSLRREMFDIPNERSSHSVPTPRGGGLVVCVVSLAAWAIYLLLAGENFYWGYFGGALLVASVSWIDDIKPLSPLVRFFFHGLAAGLAVWCFDGFGEIFVPFEGVWQIGFVGDVAAFFWIVWLVNAYNFMDGIDGIAATQAITAGIGWCLIAFISGAESIGFFGGALAASAAGFLVLNWQPAKIFMGDVGSAFLGYTFAVMPLPAAKIFANNDLKPKLFWIAVILVWFFVFDSAFTLGRRLLRGEKVWQAHREHIYQRMVIAGRSHSAVTGFYAAASAVLAVAIVSALRNSWSFEWTILPLVLVETVLLILFWRLSVWKKA